LKAVRGWRLFPCRTEIDRAAHPSHPAGSTGCRWLMQAAEMAGLAGGSWQSPPDPARTSWACPPRIATRALSAEARSVRAARDFTLATLRRWDTAHSSQDIAIVVSEMVTNALRHALPGPGDPGPRRPVRLGLLQQGPWVLCAVADPGTAVPVPRTPGSLVESGRGLQMICAFSDLWGYTTPSDAGKVVWAMFTARRSPPSPARYPGRPGRDPVPGTAR
jgi:anti-sigma regulatory factor (Ser/Thr protein kinase)